MRAPDRGVRLHRAVVRLNGRLDEQRATSDLGRDIRFVWRGRGPAAEDIEPEAAEVGVDLARLPVRPCP